MASKPRVLVLGGCGFVGRNFVTFLVQNDLASKIRVADKVMPAMAYMAPVHAAAFQSPLVEYKQANLMNDASVAKAFADDAPFDLVFNLAAETKFGCPDEQYQSGIVDLGCKCAASALAGKCSKFVQISTAQIYDPNKKPTKEDGKIKPWTKLAVAALALEQKLQALAGLPLVILRPAIIYGPGDLTGLTPRMVCAAAYRRLNEKYKVLWDGDVRMNTVHVSDVCRAMWTAATAAAPGSVYNLSDKGQWDQEKTNNILATLFQIKTGFFGSMLSGLAKMDFKSTCEIANEKHMQPWAEMCKEEGISNTPISPFVDQELLYGQHLSVDGSAIEALGFKYQVPEVTLDLVREVCVTFIGQKLFPAAALPS